MAHTSKYLEGALYEIIKNNFTTFGVNVVDQFADIPVIQKVNSIGPASQITARIRMKGVEYNKTNTSAVFTSLQLVHFDVEAFHPVVDGVDKSDNIAGINGRIWQLLTGLTEAANVGDVAWANIVAVKILSVDGYPYNNPAVVCRTFKCAATWN